ncbi:hypothetical protein F4780DRAFT_431160 [Xylariomycetidae sp. FL0641]|nr:hypothetical protein F4780DRAFT_431160 [Xylariomycetidae sp. FL0641]
MFRCRLSMFSSPVLNECRSSTMSPSTTNSDTTVCDVSRHVIDRRGDLYLEVGRGDEAMRFQVCSRALSRSCRFFDTLLNGKFAEARRPEKERTVKLPEDDPTAMRLLLDIMHGKFLRIPQIHELDIGLLCKVTMITDKYDMTHLLRPWAPHLARSHPGLPQFPSPHGTSGWTKQSDEIFGGVSLSNIGDTAWIAWEMGWREMFEFMMRQMALRTTQKLSADSWGACSRITGIEDVVRDTRLRIITALLNVFNTTIKTLDSNLKSGNPYTLPCRCPYAIRDPWYVQANETNEDPVEIKTKCALIILQSGVTALRSHQLWPNLLPNDYGGTALSLFWDLSDCASCFENEGGSRRCSLREYLKRGCESEVVSMESILKDEHLNHLKSQSTKSGHRGGKPTDEVWAPYQYSQTTHSFTARELDYDDGWH